MAIFASLVARLGIDNAAWTAGATKARAEVKKTEVETKKSFGAMYADLNSTFGKKSDLGKVLKLAAGGGAIAAASIAAGKFRSLGAEIGDIATNWDKFGKDQEAATAKMVGAVPIIGDVILGLHDIQMALTGEGAAVKKAEEYWKSYKETLADIAQLELVRKEGIGNRLTGINDSTRNSQAQMRILTAPEGVQRETQTEHERWREEDFKLFQEGEAEKAKVGIAATIARIEAEKKLHHTDLVWQLEEELKLKQSIVSDIDSKVNDAEEAAEILHQKRLVQIKKDAIDKTAADNRRLTDEMVRAAEEEARKIREVLENITTQQIDELKDKRQKLLDSVGGNESYHAPSSAQFRAVRGARGSMNGFVPQDIKVATPEMRLTKEQLEELKQINKNIMLLVGEKAGRKALDAIQEITASF